MSNVSERIESVLKQNGVPPREIKRTLSNLCGISYQAVSQWFSGTTKSIDSSHLAKIAKEYNISLEWLVTGVGSQPSDLEQAIATIQQAVATEEDFAFIPFYDVNGSCGNGYHNGDHVVVKGELAFKRTWLQAENLQEKDLAIITAKGESMSPTISEGSILLINCNYGRIENGKVYALVINEEVRVKRVFISFSGDCRIVSDNLNKTLYPDEVINAEELNHLHIIGRVVWTGGML